MLAGGPSSDGVAGAAQPGVDRRARSTRRTSRAGRAPRRRPCPSPISSGRRLAMTSSIICIAIADRVLAVDVGDEAAPHAEVGLGGADAVDEAVDDRRHRHATRGVQRRVEEHLAVLEVAELHAVLERLVRDAGEVVAVDHRRVHQPEDLEELVDGVVVVDLVDVGGRQRDVVLGGRGRRPSPAATCPRRGSAARPSAAGAGTRRSPPSPILSLGYASLATTPSIARR